ncbi:cytochrome c [Methylomonas sp. LWB]|uniref:c-type cytochrome n=1 Tax=Methylomonas sp. LWB TaxID=1905845 RepID=UPI0020C88160|nr:c-type cytochrome [Methylomonas sp. LWB]
MGRRWLALGAMALLTAVPQVSAERAGDAAVGRLTSETERCQECHGSEGISVADKIPNHAGQPADYLVKQLRDFQSGARQHETMTVMAADLAPADIVDIAAYFSGRPAPAGTLNGERSAVKILVEQGDDSRKVPACFSCHGPAGKGRVADGIAYPLLGGQRLVYLRSQLRNWKSGDRRNSPEGVMNRIAGALSDDEIDGLAAYLATL